jgi:RNA polymerase sigma-70 factor (ECF subfamily)
LTLRTQRSEPPVDGAVFSSSLTGTLFSPVTDVARSVVRTGDDLPSSTAAPDGNSEIFVAALQARSEDAWSALYDSCYPFIYRYALVRTSSASASEDLAASVFLEALKSIRSYRYRGKPVLAWLYAIARNVVSDYHKSQHPENTRRLSQTDLARVPIAALREASEAATAHDLLLDASADLLDLRDAINHLKLGQREVIVLHYYLGLTIPEAAVFLGKRERAVYSLHERAVAKLREFLSISQGNFRQNE